MNESNLWVSLSWIIIIAMVVAVMLILLPAMQTIVEGVQHVTAVLGMRGMSN